MITHQEDVSSPLVADPSLKTKGQIYEGIAFNFCKAATILLITLPFQKFALPLVAGAAAVFYLLAHFNGQNETRCILRMPLLTAAFWGTIALLSFYLILRPPVGS